MKIHYGDAFAEIEEDFVWFAEGLKICSIDMGRGIVQLTEPFKVIRSKIPLGFKVVPLGEQVDKEDVIKEVPKNR